MFEYPWAPGIVLQVCHSARPSIVALQIKEARPAFSGACQRCCFPFHLEYYVSAVSAILCILGASFHFYSAKKGLLLRKGDLTLRLSELKRLTGVWTPFKTVAAELRPCKAPAIIKLVILHWFCGLMWLHKLSPGTIFAQLRLVASPNVSQQPPRSKILGVICMYFVLLPTCSTLDPGQTVALCTVPWKQGYDKWAPQTCHASVIAMQKAIGKHRVVFYNWLYWFVLHMFVLLYLILLIFAYPLLFWRATLKCAAQRGANVINMERQSKLLEPDLSWDECALDEGFPSLFTFHRYFWGEQALA